MVFGTLDFAIFLPVVFGLYWTVFAKRLRAQNAFLVLASYVFYGWWDWRFTFLIALSTAVDFFVAKYLDRTENHTKRKMLLWVSLVVNLGLLGLFKYYDFFVVHFVEAFTLFGQPLNISTLQWILPAGISFYTFQTLSYTIDVYRRKLRATHDWIAFAAYVSFFPQLVAGPIERATHFLPQFQNPRKFERNRAVDGLRQMLWGFFKKLVIADNCAVFVNLAFNNPEGQSGSTLALGTVFFAFQIYGDFSGYSDIAIGTGRLFGFSIMQNFATPYFSRDIGEFWRRWHISLTTWFRDYVYIPLGGSRGSRRERIRNVLIVFLISGFWHGASVTFLAWGFINALCFIPLLLRGRNRNHLDVVAAHRALPKLSELGAMGLTFGITCIAWVFFRARTLPDAWGILRSIASPSLLTYPDVYSYAHLWTVLAMLALFIVLEWKGRRDPHALHTLACSQPRLVRWGIYYALMTLILLYMSTTTVPFYYFQF
jgi:alginate O-acetyltransferase complex protein AlgI